MNINDLRAEMYVGFMALEEHLGAKIPFFEKIRIVINRHLSAKAPLWEKVEPIRAELIESAQQAHDPAPAKLTALFFLHMASDEDINRYFEAISRFLTIQGCITLFEYFEKADRHVSRDVLRETLIARAEKLQAERKRLEKEFFTKYEFPFGMHSPNFEDSHSYSYAQKHLSAFFLSLEEYIDLLLDKRYIDDIQVRNVKNEGAVNYIQVNGNHNTIVQHSNDVVVNAPLKKAKKSH